MAIGLGYLRFTHCLIHPLEVLNWKALHTTDMVSFVKISITSKLQDSSQNAS